jgi:chromosome segregation ATPase
MKNERVIPISTLFKRLEAAQRGFIREEQLRREAETRVWDYRERVQDLEEEIKSFKKQVKEEIKSLKEQVKFYKDEAAQARKGKEGD